MLSLATFKYKTMNKKEIPSQVFRTKREAKANYDKLSRSYDVLAGFAEKKYKDVGLRKLNAKSGEKVLEIGYGTGQCIVPLAQSIGTLGKVYGIDISEGMFRVAKNKTTKAGLSERVELICGDATDLPYRENSMHAIYMSFTLELFDKPEIPVVLQQCQRVLCPGGRICVVVMALKKESNLMVMLYKWAHETFPRYIDCRPIYAQRIIEEAGFFIKDATEMSMFGLPVDIVLARSIRQKKEKRTGNLIHL